MCGGGVLPLEVSDQERNVVEPLPERRDPYGDDGEPVIEIVTEKAALNLAREGAVSGSDDAYVDGSRGPGIAHAADGPGFDGAQELTLHFEGEFTDLVEEHVPPSASSKRPTRATAPLYAPRT